MKKHLLLFAALLLPWMVKAQSIEVSNDTLSFEYAEGYGPAIQSFVVFPNELNADMVISFKKLINLHYHISKTEDNGYEDSISFTLHELEELGDEILIFVRMDENLGVNTYENTIIIRSDGDTLGQVQCTGIVNGAVAKPRFTLPEETYHGQQTVSINCDTEGATIYYTTNGEDPDENSNLYEPNEEIPIDNTTSFKAIGIKENWNNSDIASATYHIQYHIRADVSPEESGNIIYNGQYWAYIDNDIDTNVGSITLQASPMPNYSFEYWKDNNGTVVSNNSQYVIPVDRDYALTAEFKINNGNINYSVLPPGAGNVIIGGSQEIGQTATLTAIPADCYRFIQWNDGTTSNPLTFIVGENNNYTAIFELEDYTIIGNPNNEEWGSVTGGGNNFHCEDVTTLEAIPEEGYEFEKWEDGNTDNPRQIVVNGNAIYTAEFDAKRTNIIVIANPSEGGEVTGGGIYSSWDWCTVTAQANEGYSFINWTEDNDTISTNPIYTFQIKLSFGINERILVANFAQIPIVSIIETPETICDNEPLNLVIPECTNAIGGEWQLSPDTTFLYIEKYTIGKTLSQKYDGWKLRYVAYNETDTIPSNMVTVSVQSYITEDEASHQLVAKGPERGKYVLIYPNPKEGYKYQWYRDNTPITNANEQYYYEQGGLTDGDYRVYISYTEDGICGAFSPSKTISKNGSATFSIYPNPAHVNDDLIVVNGGEGETQLTLYSIDGRLLHSQTMTGSQTTIGIHLSQGIYVAYFTDKTGFVKVERIIIQ